MSTCAAPKGAANAAAAPRKDLTASGKPLAPTLAAMHTAATTAKRGAVDMTSGSGMGALPMDAVRKEVVFVRSASSEALVALIIGLLVGQN